MPPLYEYECPVCNHISTRERKVIERKKRVKCDNCGSYKPTITISQSTFALKGGSWASTGYSGAPPAGTKKVK